MDVGNLLFLGCGFRFIGVCNDQKPENCAL